MRLEATVITGLNKDRALPSFDIKLENGIVDWAVDRTNPREDIVVGDTVLVVPAEGRSSGFVIVDKL